MFHMSMYGLLLLFSGFTHAEDDRFLEVSGLQSMPAQVRNLAESLLQQTDANEQVRLQVLNDLSRWSPLRIRSHWQEQLKQYPEIQRQQVAAILNNEQMQKAQKNEQVALGERDSMAYQAYMEKLRQHPPIAARAEKIEQLDRAMFFSSLLIRARDAVYPVLSQNVKSWQPFPGWEAEVKQQAIAFLYYAYRHTSNDELDILVAQWQTPVLQQWLQNAVDVLPGRAQLD